MIFCANPSAQFYSYQKEIEDATLKVFHGTQYILGPQVSALEEEFSNYIGTNFAIGVANGTDALEIAIKSLEIGPGDEIITVSHTAVATVSAIEASGAIPVLVDVDPIFFTLDFSQLEEVLTPKTKAIIAVHLYGQSANLDAINEFCIKHNLYLIEDASQAHGAKWNEKKVGSIGHIGCFSCYPTKNLGAIGDAGLITTNDINLNRKIRMLREYGWKDRYISYCSGRNSRLDEVQAAILRVKLRYLDQDNKKRQNIACKYNALLNEVNIKLPLLQKNVDAVFHLYVAKVELRDELVKFLKENDIQAGIHYPVPIHLQPAYKNKIRTSSSLLITETLAKEVISLPIYPELEDRQVFQVAETIKEFIKAYER